MFEGNTFKNGFFEIDISHYYNGDDDSYLVYDIYFKTARFNQEDGRDNITTEYDFEKAVKFIDAENEFFELDVNHFKTKLLPNNFEIRLWCYENTFSADVYFKGSKLKSFDTIEDAIKHINGE